MMQPEQRVQRQEAASGVTPRAVDDLRIPVRDFSPTFRHLMSTFLETPRELNQELRLFSGRALKLARVAESLPHNEEWHSASAQVRDFIIELLKLGKVQLASILTHTLPLARYVALHDETYRSAATYFLGESVELGDVASVIDVAENILPGYLESSEFLTSATKRIQMRISDGSRDALADIEKFFSKITLVERGAYLKFELIRGTREPAEALAMERLGHEDYALVESLFWLDQFTSEPDVQQRLVEMCRECIAQEDPGKLCFLLSYHPLSIDALKGLRREVQEFVAYERFHVQYEEPGSFVTRDSKDTFNQHLRFLDRLFDSKRLSRS